MWGDNLCFSDCKFKQIKNNNEIITVYCLKYNKELFLYTFFGLFVDSEKYKECVEI